MNMKYYNASNNFSAPVRREPKPYSPYIRRPEVVVPQKPYNNSEVKKDIQNIQQNKKEPKPFNNDKSNKINFSNLKADDLLLLGIIAVLIWNSCDDTLLILALGYLFMAGL